MCALLPEISARTLLQCADICDLDCRSAISPHLHIRAQMRNTIRVVQFRSVQAKYPVTFL